MCFPCDLNQQCPDLCARGAPAILKPLRIMHDRPGNESESPSFRTVTARASADDDTRQSMAAARGDSRRTAGAAGGLVSSWARGWSIAGLGGLAAATGSVAARDCRLRPAEARPSPAGLDTGPCAGRTCRSSHNPRGAGGPAREAERKAAESPLCLACRHGGHRRCSAGSSRTSPARWRRAAGGPELTAEGRDDSTAAVEAPASSPAPSSCRQRRRQKPPRPHRPRRFTEFRSTLALC